MSQLKKDLVEEEEVGEHWRFPGNWANRSLAAAALATRLLVLGQVSISKRGDLGSSLDFESAFYQKGLGWKEGTGRTRRNAAAAAARLSLTPMLPVIVGNFIVYRELFSGTQVMHCLELMPGILRVILLWSRKKCHFCANLYYII